VTFSQFFGDYLAALAKVEHQRRGQLFFNRLSRYRPDLSSQIRGTDLDPFYDDNNLPGAVDFCDNNW
jgi:hypothetical protein